MGDTLGKKIDSVYIVNDIKKSTFRKDVIYDNSNIIMSMSGN